MNKDNLYHRSKTSRLRSEDLKQEAEGLWQNAKNMKQQVVKLFKLMPSSNDK